MQKSSLNQKIAERLFWPLAATTRTCGGIIPFRIMNWLGKYASGSIAPTSRQFQWCLDRYGSRMLLHPYYFIDRHIIAFGEYERELQLFMAKNIQNGMTCFDVGANIGAVTVPLARLVGESGKVFAFEPNPPIAERLRKNVEGNAFNWVCIETCALSDSCDVLPLAVADLSHENQGMSSLVEYNHVALTNTIDIPVTTLDEYISTKCVEGMDFIKVDIQGAELQFIKGAKRAIQKFSPMIAMEVAPTCLGAAQMTSDELIASFETIGVFP